MTRDEARQEILRRRAQLPIYQLFGLFGLNPYQDRVDAYERRKREQRRQKSEGVVDSSIAGLDQLLAQLQSGQGDLFSLAATQSLGKGASALRSVAGMGGVAGSGLQALGGSQLASNVLAQLSQNIASNQLQRIQLGAGLLTSKAGLATGWEELLLKDYELQQRGQQADSGNPLAKLLYSIAKSFFSKGAS